MTNLTNKIISLGTSKTFMHAEDFEEFKSNLNECLNSNLEHLWNFVLDNITRIDCTTENESIKFHIEITNGNVVSHSNIELPI